MPTSDKPSYVIGSDGLPLRISGAWARRKHHYLRNYCGITTTSMRGKFPGGVVYLDVMAGPGTCLDETVREEFDGSPLVALAHDFSSYYFIEEHPELFAALDKRLKNHPKRERIHLINENWADVAAAGKLQFDARTLVVAFVDPTGISDTPMSAMRALMQNPRIDLLVTIQYRLSIVWNAPLYVRSASEDTALDRFLDSPDWRQWQCRDASELGSRAVDAFCEQIKSAGFKSARHVSVPEMNPLYRFAYFSRHECGTEFWNKILKTDERGQTGFSHKHGF